MNESAQLSRNKEIVLDFMETAITNREPIKAIDRYVGDVYIQHNPNFADGPDAIRAAFPAILESYPDMTIEIKKVIAEGDLVVLLIHTKMNKDDRGNAVMDIFRLDEGKIVEHWDVTEAIPENSANDNTMF